MKTKRIKVTIELEVELKDEDAVDAPLDKLQDLFEDLEILSNTLQDNDYTVTVKTLE